MHLRRIEWIALPLALIAGGLLPRVVFSGDPSRLLITFLGLMSASILPSISLIIGSMTASGRSVKAINELEAELSAAMDALFMLFGLVALAVALMMCLAAPLPQIITAVHHLEGRIQRTEQAIISAIVTLIIIRSGQVPAILRRALAIRRDIAVDEAKRKTIEKAPSVDATRQSFGRHESFGRVVTLSGVDKGE